MNSTEMQYITKGERLFRLLKIYKSKQLPLSYSDLEIRPERSGLRQNEKKAQYNFQMSAVRNPMFIGGSSQTNDQIRH